MRSFKLLSLLIVCGSSAALAGDFIDTRVTFAFAHDNVFVRPGETTPNSPGVGFGASRQNTQFFDNFNTRFSGFETLSNLTLYKKAFSFFDGFEGEAALSVLLLTQPSGQITLFDNSSYIKLNYKPIGWGAREDISLTGFPVSSDRFRLGYNWRVTWGGDSAFTFQQGSGLSSTGRPSAAPGGKLQITKDWGYAFVGLKTGLLLNNLLNVQERVYGYLGGAGIDLFKREGTALRFEVNGGYFNRGIAPSLALQGVRAPINATGGSARLSFQRGAEIQQSIDIRLYKNDPDVLTRFFTPEKYPGGFSITAELEGSVLVQTLIDPDRFATTRPQIAGAIALNTRAKIDFWRITLLGLVRTLSFIQFDVPGFPPFFDFSNGSTVRPETWLALGVDRYVPVLHSTFGLIGGVQLPASLSAPRFDFGGGSPPPGLTGPRVVVVRDVNLFNILPATDANGNPVQVLPIFSIKGTYRLDLSDYFAIIGEVFYTRDDNRVTFRDSTANISQPTFEQPNQLGFNAVIQARF
ncbi:MAG: hypothetical protein SFW67_26985 [Myxococcaceae bacterium]|nr:hypothetical protein [Myxococcaceae bacterium]